MAAVAAGVVDYVLKPFGFADLEERLERYAAQRRLLDRTQVHGQDDVDRVFARGGRSAGGRAAQGDERRDGAAGRGRAARREGTLSATEAAELVGVSPGQRPPLPRALRDIGQAECCCATAPPGAPSAATAGCG